jgi:hypothetical protein
LLEFLDLRFVTGYEGLYKVTSWLGFRWEFEAMLGTFIRAFSRKILDGV